MLDQWRFLFDGNYRDQALGFFMERVPIMLLGIGVIIVGLVFLVRGTPAGDAAATAVKMIATKGK